MGGMMAITGPKGGAPTRAGSALDEAGTRAVRQPYASTRQYALKGIDYHIDRVRGPMHWMHSHRGCICGSALCVGEQVEG